MPLFSKLDWGRERAYGSAIGELLQALYQALLFASEMGRYICGERRTVTVCRYEGMLLVIYG